MRQYLLHLSEKLRTSFLTVPATMIVVAILLASLLRLLDNWYDPAGFTGLDWLRIRDAESARALLSTIAASTITVAGTVFSITVVALTLASNQFGPRVVRNFVRDRSTQVALGIFLATFVYALVTIRSIDVLSDTNRSYDLAVHAGVFLALVSIGFLVFFIHNVAQTIQVDNITHQINKELHAAIAREYPKSWSDAEGEKFDEERLDLGSGWVNIPSGSGGYVQLINKPALKALAEKYDCCLHITCHPGAYITHWGVIGRVYQPPAEMEELIHGTQWAVEMGPVPTAEQDIVFSIRQLSQIAVRALSPGVNDPFTAYTCVDRLVEGLGTVLQRPEPPNCFADDTGRLRLITCELSFSDLLDASLDEICEHGRANGVFVRHLLASLLRLSRACGRGDDRSGLLAYVKGLEEDCEIFIESRRDLEKIKSTVEEITAQLTN
ncbi:DUF2254 domain-containing protein [Microbulbifer yueqingensis]|uniref:Uncharacterized membrane protein n=1 Tax=Microbulbifer yueqingensis TaxID=658219 RepID=A0A1G8V701_9GAMM|nr:DUF2254 domain-containing protein [Microbulbifer yueqingensis]SDJ61647.1 Uncharacterized membrane protein [Microbulbifer yueqingensis]